MRQTDALVSEAHRQLREISPTYEAVAGIDSGQVRKEDISGALERLEPLAGRLIGIKDMIDVEGMPTKCGSLLGSSEAKAEDSDVVARLRRAGGVPAVKTVTHEFAFGPTGDVSSTGPVPNPHDGSRMAGGSSGGSAALLGAGAIHHALGTDTGGSGRTPAAWCGVFGLRPTLGALSSDGVFPLAPSFDTVSPMSTSVRGLMDLWQALTVDDNQILETSTVEIPMRGAPVVGMLKTGHWAKALPQISQGISAHTRLLTQHGCSLTEINASWTARANRLYPVIVGFEALQTHQRNIVDRPERFQPEVLERLRAAGKTSSEEYEDALAEVAGLREQVDELFDGADILACPTSPVGAQSLLQRSGFDAGLNTVFDIALAFTAPFSVLGVPALSLPVGYDHRGLPVGMQLVGKPNSELELLKLADILSSERDSRSKGEELTARR